MTTLALMILSVTFAAPPTTPVFVARDANGKLATGTISRIEADGSVVLDGEPAMTLPGADLITLRQKGVSLPPFPGGPHILFANGDRLGGEVLSIEGGQLRFKAWLGRDGAAEGAHELSIPTSALSVIWFHSPPSRLGEALNRQWANERRRRDVVRTKNGDMRSGTIREIKAGNLVLDEGEGRETALEVGRILAIAMNTDSARTLRPRGPYPRLVLANGARLSLSSASAGSIALTGKTVFGPDVTIGLNRVVSFEVRQGKAVYLSDLKPKAYEHVPFFGVKWPYSMDRSLAGAELRLAGNTFDKGVAMHSQSRLTFALDGRYRRFETLVGLDERMGVGGRANVRVLVDGKDCDLGGGDLAYGAAAKMIDVPVADAKELTLVVEFGAGGDVCDHIDWVEARVIR